MARQLYVHCINQGVHDDFRQVIAPKDVKANHCCWQIVTLTSSEPLDKYDTVIALPNEITEEDLVRHTFKYNLEKCCGSWFLPELNLLLEDEMMNEHFKNRLYKSVERYTNDVLKHCSNSYDFWQLWSRWGSEQEDIRRDASWNFCLEHYLWDDCHDRWEKIFEPLIDQKGFEIYQEVEG